MKIKILDVYVARTVFSAIGLVTLMLAGLQIFILFVNQLDALGNNDFGIVQACLFVLLQMPYQVYLFFPMASLLGCLIGLGILANHSELIVMRAAGMSIAQISGSVLKAAVFIIFLVTLLGETLVPKLSYYANDYKAQALSGGQTLRLGHGVWLRYDHDFIFIEHILPDHILQKVYQFRFDRQHHLQWARKIKEIKYLNNKWMAYEVQHTEFTKEHTKSMQFPSLPWDVGVNPRILAMSSTEPDEMSLPELNRYLREQKRTQQNAHAYKLAFFQRMIQPITTMVMMILAIPFIFGPLRSSTMGSKLLVGAVVGFGFHILNRFFGPVSMVFQLPPELAALGPTAIFALLGFYLMKKIK